MKLTNDQFIHVIDSTPLVAIDLVIRNERGDVLLGKRRNRPAQNYWFVPGGRIRKNERLQDALQRIAYAELKMAAPSGRLIGVFDHVYDDNFLGVADIGTHYVTIAYQFEIDGSNAIHHDDQHSELRWWGQESLLASQEVHANTKLYFSDVRGNGFRCERNTPAAC